jgi:hypothetical protein
VKASPSLQFTTTILQFADQGEKTGWTYIVVPAAIGGALNPKNRKTFRVKGKLDEYPIQQIALLPMRNGDFIMALNAAIRKGIGKRKGAKLNVKLALDKNPLVISKELMECLEDEPRALVYFNSLAPSHRGYFSKWIESAKTDETKAKRIAQSVSALAKQFNYGQMLRSLAEKRIP